MSKINILHGTRGTHASSTNAKAKDATVAVQWQWWATVSTWQKRAALGKKAEDMTT